MSDSPVPFRVGQALDVHAFASAESVAARPGRVMMLACLPWPGEVPLEGHSDGDVAAHAVCDAVLAATGLVVLVLTLLPSTPSVRRGRLGDLAEAAALLALLPLTVVAIGLFSEIRG